jgi:two-component system sensor histidine kinase/response regulator
MNSGQEKGKAVSEHLQHSGTINILVVDDRIENIISIESVLENGNRNILKALSGEEALRIASEMPIGLILLDIQMPGMDGFTLARKLKENEQTKDISIIFVTALSGDEKYVLQGFEEGAVDYLHKPLNINILEAKVTVFERLYVQQQEVKAYMAKLESLNKQLDEFVYIVSHDLKAPLRGIASLGTFIEEELGESISPAVKEIVDMMKSRTVRMQHLIDSILHYSRMANMKSHPEQVNVRQLLEGVFEMVTPPPHMQVILGDNFPSFSTEKVKLHEVFQNLISNAIKYNDKADARITVSCKDLGTEHIGKIFSIFHTLQPKDSSDSTGIGLTIVKKLVEQMGGEISVYSEFGKGSQFSFTWPKNQVS